MSTPYIGFGNDTLAKLPPLLAGDTIQCPQCGKPHVVTDSTPPMLLFYECGGKSFMAGLNGKNTMKQKVDCSWEIDL